MKAATLKVPSRTRARSRARRGFTLIELMVALTGGLLFTIFVFSLTKDVSRFFARESRMSDTTLSAIGGFQRVRADIARAGFLASPNLARDPGRCPRGPVATALSSAGWMSNDLLRQMGVLRIGNGTEGVEQTENGLTPDQLTLWGAYTAAEQFPARAIEPAAGGGYRIRLEPSSGAMLRLGYDPTVTDGTMEDLLERVFPANRALRIVNQEGEEQYGIIAAVDDGDSPFVAITAALPLTMKSTTGTTCGVRGNGGGLLVNTVSIIRYDLMSLADATDFPEFQYLFTGQRPDFEAGRLDLVRSELLPADGTDPVNHELVAEYAVDLGFSLSVVSNLTSLALTEVPEEDPTIPKYASDPTASPAADANSGPHLIRGVRARLAVRSIAPDRQADISATNVGPGLYRIALTDGDKDYARVRSLQSLIAIRNTRNKLWN